MPMPTRCMPPRPLQPLCTNALVADEDRKTRRSLQKRLVTRIKQLRTEREAEVFIEERLKITQEEERTTEEVVNRLHRLFAESDLGFKYTELIKSGSLEKGTAIHGMADVDLVLYFPPTPSLACSPTEPPLSSPTQNYFNFNEQKLVPNPCSLEKLRTKHEKVQNEMRKILENIGDIAHHFEIQHQNPYVDQLNFQSTPTAPSYQVDLTLAVDFDQPSPLRSHLPRDFVERVKRDSGNFFSSSFTREQNNYIRNQPDRVKNLIRLVKFWYKVDVPDLTNLPPAECKFKSYLFELLTIGVWRKYLNGSEHFEMLRAFKTVLTAITQHDSMYLVVGEQQPAPDIRSQRPLIVGPNNEYENVAKSGKKWEELSRIARLTMNEANLISVQPYPLVTPS